jgi:hypothetical protein
MTASKASGGVVEVVHAAVMLISGPALVMSWQPVGESRAVVLRGIVQAVSLNS